MPIFQCEKCWYGNGITGNIYCTHPQMSLEEKRGVQDYGKHCVKVRKIDFTDQGEPWPEKSPGYPF